MKTLTAPEDLYPARLARTRQAMLDAQVPVMLILDPVNILYATGASNMTLFATRTPARYLLLFAEGPAILFDYFGCEHLSCDLSTIDDVRPASGLCYVSAGGKVEENAAQLATTIYQLVTEHARGTSILAIDRFPYPCVDALRAKGFKLQNADLVMAQARRIKMADEISYMREAMRRVEAATKQFENSIRPGASEAGIWSIFHKGLIESEGRYVTTRLMQSGENTFPYFQECGDRILQSGDLVCLDTDSVGYLGYAVDFSRTFICGDAQANDKQKRLFDRARDQLEHNVALLMPGVSYEEVAQQAWQVPIEHQDSRYYCIAHGLGMSGEFPNIAHLPENGVYPIEGQLEAGMVLCAESYIGSAVDGEGVKLEQQILITETGHEIMSSYPFDARFD